MTENLIADKAPAAEEAATLLEQMAARLRLNKADALGGCFVIVPPEGGGDSFSYLGLDSTKDPILFYQLLSSRLKAVLDQLDMQQRKGMLGR